MLELEEVRDEPTLGALRHNETVRSLAVGVVFLWFVSTLAIVSSVRLGLSGDVSGLMLWGVGGAFAGWVGYRATRELVCFVGGPVCHYCRAEDARWRARDAPEGNR